MMAGSVNLHELFCIDTSEPIHANTMVPFSVGRHMELSILRAPCRIHCKVYWGQRSNKQSNS